MWLPFVCFFVCVFVFLFLGDLFLFLSLLCPFLVTISFASYFLVRFLLPTFLLLFSKQTCSRFDLAWFRRSCDHGWVRSGSVNVE